MRAAGRALLCAAVAVPFLVGFSQANQGATVQVAATVRDPELTELSGLAVVGEYWAAVNDSGDTGRVFLLDPRTGQTVRTVPFGEARDVEALAPEGTQAVWVGDIGDNRARRSTITVHRVPLDGGGVSSIQLRYPDGARDAEALLRDPTDGSLYVVSKEILGAGIYRVPAAAVRTGSGTLQRIGAAPSLITDGAISPDGAQLVLRSYLQAHALGWPNRQRLDSQRLPAQPQGEAIAYDGVKNLLLGSEGVNSEVLRLPVLAATSTASATPSPEPSPESSSEPSPEPSPTEAAATTAGTEQSEPQLLRWGIGAVAVLAVLVAAGAVWRSTRSKHS